MAEVEIHTAHGHVDDPFGQRVGILVGVIGIVLSIVTILSHREHNAAVVHKTEANDQWAFYQAKKIREHNEDIGNTLLTGLAADPAKVAALSAKLTQERDRYAKEAEQIQAEAKLRDDESAHAEKRGLLFDLGEGFLELGLVMSSLYFLSKKRFFVGLGGIAALIGTVVGMLGFIS